jgi:hypothetical protein
MTAVINSPDINIHSRSSWTRTLPRATALVAALSGASTTAAAVALRTAGVPLAVHGRIPLAGFAQITIIGAVIGGVLVAWLNRFSSTPRRQFIRLTIGLTALSFVLPAAFAETASSKIALVGLHLLAAAIIVPVLVRQAS